MAAAGMALSLAIPHASAHGRAAGFVYTETTAPGGNAVKVACAGR
ncbi:MAG: hypothetical protein U0838_06790 [Chloroflexota bacterium]